MEVIQQLIETSGLYNLTIQNIIMLIIAVFSISRS